MLAVARARLSSAIQAPALLWLAESRERTSKKRSGTATTSATVWPITRMLRFDTRATARRVGSWSSSVAGSALWMPTIVSLAPRETSARVGRCWVKTMKKVMPRGWLEMARRRPRRRSASARGGAGGVAVWEFEGSCE